MPNGVIKNRLIILTALDAQKYLTREFDSDSFEGLFHEFFESSVAAVIILTCQKKKKKKVGKQDTFIGHHQLIDVTP